MPPKNSTPYSLTDTAPTSELRQHASSTTFQSRLLYQIARLRLETQYSMQKEENHTNRKNIESAATQFKRKKEETSRKTRRHQTMYFSTCNQSPEEINHAGSDIRIHYSKESSEETLILQT